MTFKLVESICCVDSETCRANVKSALARGLPVCTRSPRRTGALAIVGSAPSVLGHVDELRAWPGEIWAINGAYDFLRDLGIVAHAFIGMDPLGAMAEYVKNPHKDTTFFISSVCDPKLFDALKDQHVWMWHSKWDEMVYPHDAKVVSGGTTCITRAPFLANMLGWRDMTIFGADSSYAEGPYCYKHGRYSFDTVSKRLYADVDGQRFETELPLIKQVAQLGTLGEFFNGQLKFKCGGLLAAYMRSPMRSLDELAA